MTAMFKPTSDRLDYSRMLMPPDGYETDFAVGTTYSLDLDALIGASIALGLSESIDSELMESPIYLLEALRKTADKVIIFCEAGQIKAPQNAHALHILLENMVCEVTLKNKKSFHPKFWLIRYKNRSGEEIYRCLVLSRNLTFDRCWDVAACLEGKAEIKQKLADGYESSRPLRDFLNALIKTAWGGRIASAKREALKKLLSDILNVKFDLMDKRFTDYSFYPVGIPGYNISKTGLFGTYHNLSIISPFLSDGIIKKFNELALGKNDIEMNKKNTLITRKSELSKLEPAHADKFDIFVMKDLVVDGEEALSEGSEDSLLSEKQKQDIHAKLYLKTKGSRSELYLGSLNATESACHGNVEFLLKLCGKQSYFNTEMLRKDLFGDDEQENPFEKVDLAGNQEPEPPKGVDAEKIIKELCRIKSGAKVLESGGSYGLEVTFDRLPGVPESVSLLIHPLLLPGKEEKLSESIVFTELKLLHLSEFFVIKVETADETVKRVIKIKTEGLPQSRESALINNIIRDKNGFIQYITFLLGDDYLLSILENRDAFTGSFTFRNGGSVPALYEKMLKAAAHDPYKFEEIKKIMDMITDDSIIPEGFEEVYKVFYEAVFKKK